MKAREVKDALRRRHGVETDSGEWVVVEEAFCGWTSGGGGIDLLAVGAWATAKAPGLPGAGRVNLATSKEAWEQDARHPIVAYEVKVSRADLRRELYGYAPGPKASWKARRVPPWPGKQWHALRVAHYFMLVVPAGLMTEEEKGRRTASEKRLLFVPPEAGLIEVDEAGRCQVAVPAPRRVPRPIERGEMAELLRHAVKPNVLRKLRTENGRLRADNDSLRRQQTEGWGHD